MQGVLECASGLLQSNYRAQGQQALNHQQSAVQQLLSQRQLPPRGWSDLQIQSLMHEIAMMDSNNFIDNVGVGEREGRVHSALVQSRHMHLAHGIGRSGDLLAQQPKAAGSSLLHTLTHALTLHAVRLAGLTEARQVLLLPVATGMSIVLTLMALKQQHPLYVRQQQEASRYAQQVAAAAMADSQSADGDAIVGSAGTSSPPSFPPAPTVSPLYVIWSRIDQKTCLKSITAAGCVPVVLELVRVGDQLETDLPAMERAIRRLGSDNIVAVVSTTSCFAPRAPDKVVEISKLCSRLNVAHVVNNAYGLQSASTCALLNAAVRKGGRVDAVISSMDKNFLVPVGGAFVVGFQSQKQRAGAETATKQMHYHQQAKEKQKKQQQQHGGATASNGPMDAASTASSAAAAASPSASVVPSNASAGATASLPPPPASSAPAPAPLPNVLDLISALYPGRASASSLVDLFLTLMGLGAEGWTRMLARREALWPVLRDSLAALAAAHGERMLHTPDNPISLAMTLDRLDADAVGQFAASAESAAANANATTAAPASAAKDEPNSSEQLQSRMASMPNTSVSTTTSPATAAAATTGARGPSSGSTFTPGYLGSLLFSRNVSGPRCLSPSSSPSSSIGGLRFEHYGTHCASYPHAYVTAACGVGMDEDEVRRFVQRLDKCIAQFHKQKDKRAKQQQSSSNSNNNAAANNDECK